MKDMGSLEFLRFWRRAGCINKVLAYGHFALFCTRVIDQKLHGSLAGEDGSRIFSEDDISYLAGCDEHGVTGDASEYFCEKLESKSVINGLIEAGLIKYEESPDGFALAPEVCFR